MPNRFILLFLLGIVPLIGADSADVTLDGRILWTLQVGRSGFTPEERAADIESNLVHIAEDPRRNLEEVREIDNETESILLVDRVYLFSVTDDDAKASGQSRGDLFAQRKQAALEAIAAYRSNRSWVTILKTALKGVAALLAAIGFVMLLRMLHGRIAKRFNSLLARWSARSQMGAVYRLFRRPLVVALRFLILSTFLATGMLACFAALSYILGLIPFTAGIAGAVVSAAMGAVRKVGSDIVGYLPNLMVLLLVAFLCYAAIKAAKVVAKAVESGALDIPGFHQDWAIPTYDLLKILLILFALVVAFPYLPGGDSPALRGASIFIGVLVSLGSGSAMGNVIAGVILTYMRPFVLGDRVSIAETEGDVIERSLLVTRIRTIKNVEVILPNSQILGAHIVNYSANSLSRGLILNTTITIGYDAPWKRVHELLIQAALKTPHVLADPEPFVFQTSLNDSHVSYEINAFTNEANLKAATYSELHKNIQEAFNEGGLEIMSPMYLSVRDGNTITTPESYRPRGYEAPTFRIPASHRESAAKAATATANQPPARTVQTKPEKTPPANGGPAGGTR